MDGGGVGGGALLLWRATAASAYLIVALDKLIRHPARVWFDLSRHLLAASKESDQAKQSVLLLWIAAVVRRLCVC